jgi:carboxyl-terminal processing protease
VGILREEDQRSMTEGLMSTTACSDFWRWNVCAAVLAVLVSSVGLAEAPSSGSLDLDNQNIVEKGSRLSRAVVKDFAATLGEAVELLDEAHIKKTSRRQLLEWAIRGLYARLDEPVPPSVVSRLERINRWTKAEMRKLLAEARAHLGKRRYLENLRDIDLALAGIFSKLELGVEHAPASELRERFQCIQWAYIPLGVGVETVLDDPSGLLRVVTPLRDSPAHLAGVRAGDLITSLSELDKGRSEDHPEPYSGAELVAQPGRLKGPPDSRVRLTVRRAGTKQLLSFVLQRKKIATESVFGSTRKADASWDYLLDREQKIGYLRLTSLIRETPRDFAAALADLQKQGLKGLILDLRCSPGGLFSTAESVAAQLAGKGPFSTGRTRTVSERYELTGAATLSPRVPLVCLVNGETRRSAELLAACLQDRGRAVILGERTPGETAIQNCCDLPCGTLSYAYAVLDRASGRNLSRIMTSGKEEEEWGVRPSKGFEVKLATAENEKLAQHLHEQRIISPPGRSFPATTADFSDRQLSLALDYLRNSPVKPR